MARPCSASMRCPRHSMVPAVGSMSLSTVLPMVDLPQPDSPTRPSVSPWQIEKLTSSTACTLPRARPKTPPRMGKCLVRRPTWSSGGDAATAIPCSDAFMCTPTLAAGLAQAAAALPPKGTPFAPWAARRRSCRSLGARISRCFCRLICHLNCHHPLRLPAGGPMAARFFLERRIVGLATRRRVRAARREGTADDCADQRWHGACNLGEPPACGTPACPARLACRAELRNGVEQAARVRMAGTREQIEDRSLL